MSEKSPVLTINNYCSPVDPIASKQWIGTCNLLLQPRSQHFGLQKFFSRQNFAVDDDASLAQTHNLHVGEYRSDYVGQHSFELQKMQFFDKANSNSILTGFGKFRQRCFSNQKLIKRLKASPLWCHVWLKTIDTCGSICSSSLLYAPVLLSAKELFHCRSANFMDNVIAWSLIGDFSVVVIVSVDLTVSGSAEGSADVVGSASAVVSGFSENVTTGTVSGSGSGVGADNSGWALLDRSESSDIVLLTSSLKASVFVTSLAASFEVTGVASAPSNVPVGSIITVLSPVLTVSVGVPNPDDVFVTWEAKSQVPENWNGCGIVVVVGWNFGVADPEISTLVDSEDARILTPPSSIFEESSSPVMPSTAVIVASVAVSLKIFSDNFVTLEKRRRELHLRFEWSESAGYSYLATNDY